MFKLIRFLRPQRGKVAIVLLLAMAGSLANLLLPRFMSEIVDQGIVPGDTRAERGRLVDGVCLRLRAAGDLGDGGRHLRNALADLLRAAGLLRGAFRDLLRGACDLLRGLRGLVRGLLQLQQGLTSVYVPQEPEFEPGATVFDAEARSRAASPRGRRLRRCRRSPCGSCAPGVAA